MTKEESRPRLEAKNVIRAAVGFAVYLLLGPALLFITAGTVAWPMAWAYVAMLLAATLGSRLVVLIRSPETLRERARFRSAEGTKAWDRVLVLIVGLCGPLTTMVVAGLDHRFGWPPIIPDLAQYAAALVVAGGYGFSVWAMVENEYFSAVARIQEDRGQEVVTGGPYSIVRHPAYAGSLIASLALPFMLSTLSSLIPALITATALVIRTYLEDAMLRDELEGYESYASRTRARLIPGIW